MFWRRYFRLRPISANLLGISQINNIDISEHAMIYPRLAVIPMGWTWTLWCQTLHERIVATACYGEDGCLRDHKPDPTTSTIHIEAVDNLVCLGSCLHQVTFQAKQAVEALRSSGLVVHEEVEAAGDCAALGWTFEGPAGFQPCRRRVWRARMAIRQLLAKGRCSGRTLERIVGHLPFISVGRRESLSVLGSCFAFIKANYDVPRIRWAQVRQELSMRDCLASLLVRDLCAKWSEKVHSVDATDWGFGCMQGSGGCRGCRHSRPF